MLNDLDGEVLLAETEELEVAESSLLGLGLSSVSVDLDTEEVSLVLEVEFALFVSESSSLSDGYRAHVGDVEQVLGSNNVSGGNGHQVDTSRLVLRLGLPVDKHDLSTFALLSRLPVLFAHRAPLKVLNALNLDTLLVEEAHRRELVDLDSRARDDLGDVSVIGGPLEQGPLESRGLVASLRGLLVGESSENSGGLDVPDDKLVALVFRSERLSEGEGLVRPGDKVVLARRELDESNSWVGKSKDVDADGTVEFGSGPERDTDSVERGEVSTERGPLEVEVSPFLVMSALTLT